MAGCTSECLVATLWQTHCPLHALHVGSAVYAVCLLCMHIRKGNALGQGGLLWTCSSGGTTAATSHASDEDFSFLPILQGPLSAAAWMLQHLASSPTISSQMAAPWGPLTSHRVTRVLASQGCRGSNMGVCECLTNDQRPSGLWPAELIE